MIDTLLLYLHALSQPSCVLLVLASAAVTWALVEWALRLGNKDSRLVREAEAIARIKAGSSSSVGRPGGAGS